MGNIPDIIPKLVRLAVLLLAWVGLVVPGAGLTPAQAQGDDWTAPYRPAMLPLYAGDMLAHADAPRYAIDLTLAVGAEAVTVTGTQMVEYTNRQSVPLNEIVFRLYPNLPSYGAVMTVSDVTLDGAAVVPVLDDSQTVLTVPLPAPLSPGARVVLNMAFAITITPEQARLYAQFSAIDGVLALPNAYPVLSVYEPGSGWWQVTDHPQGDAVYSETAFYWVRVTAPHDLIVVASGSVVDLMTNADGTLTHVFAAPLMRDFALFASADFVSVTDTQDGTVIRVTYDPGQPGSEEAARVGLAIVKDAVATFNGSFGAYPYSELDVVQTPNHASGLEYPGIFVIARSVWSADDAAFDFVLVHEAAHEWWYGLVGNDQTRDPWIDEALAQYAVAVYIHDWEGSEAYAYALETFRIQYEQYVKRYPDQDQFIGEPVSRYDNNAYFYMVYQKGPLFYAALDDQFGYDRLNVALETLFAEYRYGIVTPEDMLASFEASLGTDLDALFAEWVGVFAVG